MLCIFGMELQLRRHAPDAWLEGAGERGSLKFFLYLTRNKGRFARFRRGTACALRRARGAGIDVPDAVQRPVPGPSVRRDFRQFAQKSGRRANFPGRASDQAIYLFGRDATNRRHAR